MTRSTAVRMGTLAAIVAAFAVAWLVLAPPQLGGATRYAIVEGTSMEPALQAGDLAVIRPRESVGKGDVVLYRSSRLDARVLHRIVREAGGSFVTKGDNNDFLDDPRPTADDVEGQLWFAVPHLGAMVTWARRPTHAALVVFALAFFAFGGGAVVAAARRPSRRRGPGGAAREESRTPIRSGALAQTVLSVAVCGLGAFAALALVSYGRSTTRTEAVPDAYAHVGTFSYGAEVEPSDVYPDGSVDTGESAFLSLVPELDVGFSYELEAAKASRVRGVIALTAVLSDGAGWSREIPLQERVTFVGSTSRAAGRLDLVELGDIVEEMKALTGSGTSTFALGVTADVELRGRVADERVRQSFTARLPLLLDPVSLRPDTASGDSSPFTVRRSEAIVVREPASLAIGGLRLSVEHARRIALLGLLVAAIVVAIAGAAVWRSRTGGEPSQIAALFGDRMITISRPPSVPPQRVTDLTDAQSLQRVAEHHDRIVLHWREGHDHLYEVDDGGSVYRYRSSLGVEPGLGVAADEDDTLVLPPTKLPRRAAAG